MNSLPSYYLETNSIYQLRKIKNPNRCFTSALTICELITGLDELSFTKRKSLLKNIFDQKVEIDWNMPEEIIFNAYDISQGFELVDKRPQKIVSLLNTIYSSGSFQEFKALDTSNEFDSLKEIEERWSLKFVSATLLGQQALKASFQIKPEDSIEMNGHFYNLRTHKELETFLLTEFKANRAISINAFGNLLFETDAVKNEGHTEEEIYNSYNGLIDHFMDAYTKKVTILATSQNIPHLNDFVDLLHVLYLRNSDHCKIVSNDKIFKAINLQNTINIENLF